MVVRSRDNTDGKLPDELNNNKIHFHAFLSTLAWLSGVLEDMNDKIASWLLQLVMEIVC